MSKSSIPRDPKVYVSLAVLFVVLLIVMPRSGKFNYDYKKGSPWAYETLSAEFDFPILKTADQIQSEMVAAGKKMVPYFIYSDEAALSVMKKVESADMGAALRPRVLSALHAVYTKGVVADSEASLLDSESSDGLVFIQRNRQAAKAPASDLYTVSSACSKVLAEASVVLPSADSVLNAAGVYAAITPNVIYDKEKTELIQVQSLDDISPTSGFVSAGQILVSNGEMVTAEVQQILDSYKSEYENSLGYAGPRVLLWIGNALIALALVLILFLSVYYTNPVAFGEMNRFLYLLFIFLLTFCLAVFVEKTNPQLLYMMPFSLSALYLLAFFRKRVVLPVYVISLLPLLIFTHNGIELYVMYLVAGVVTMYVFDYFNRGARQFVTALIAFAALAVTFMGFRFINDVRGFADMYKFVYLFIGALLSVAGYPFIYLFEKVFMLVSSSRLAELADTNNKLLVELSQKAPGTFQHCLQVMNMSDAAARSIDANVLLVRAGALYHDIGKMNNPQCFVENQTMGTNFHENLSPEESAKEIIRHVDDGLALADKHGLPGIIKDFISAHHGTTRTEYFYNKYVNDGGDSSNTAPFEYHGHKPTTKEQVIVMLCDTLEAAARTLKDNNPETFNAFVENIVDSKIRAGQLDDADISMKELGIMKSVLKDYLRQIYHDRIAYPKRKR